MNHRHLFVFVVLFAIAPQVESTAHETLDLWPDDPPTWPAASGEEGDTTGPDDREVAGRPVIRLGNVRKPQLLLFPADEAKTTIIICPGGGYSILAWDLEGTEIAEWFQSNGVSAAVLKYRVPSREADPRWLAPVQDIQRSLALIRRIDHQGFDTRHVGILGFSAGGHASMMSATATKRYYQPVDDFDKESFRPDFAALIYPGYLTEDKASEVMSDDINIGVNTPPMFLAHAFDDSHNCMGSVGLFARLKRKGIPASLHIFSTGGHGFGGRNVGAELDHWLPLCKSWLHDQGWL